MAKTKVRVLYPTAFAAMGIEAEGGAEVSVDDDQASALITAGYAEQVKAKADKPKE